MFDSSQSDEASPKKRSVPEAAKLLEEVMAVALIEVSIVPMPRSKTALT